MTRIKKYLLLSLLVAIILVSVVGFGFKPLLAKAHTDKNIGGNYAAADDGSATPYGIYTNLSLGLDGGDGEVWAIVKNEFTLFPATVYVVVELYSSYTYQESHSTMTLVCHNSIRDLNMGQTVQARSSTNGEQKYWKARTYYQIDGKGWKESETDCLLIGADGIYIM